MTDATCPSRLASHYPSSLSWRALILCGLLTLLLLLPLPGGGRAVGAMLDLCHAPVFAALVVGLSARFRPGRRAATWQHVAAALVAWLLVACFGLLSEGIQAVTGRHASLHDALANVLGATAGLMAAVCRFVARGYRPIGWGIAGLALMSASLPPLATLADVYLQRTEFPSLASFEHPLELMRWKPINSTLARTTSSPDHDSFVLQVNLAPGRFSGATLDCPPANWSARSVLVLDVCLHAEPPLDLTIKIEDAQHRGEPSDRFEQTFHLQPGWQRLTVDTADVASAPRDRWLDLEQVSKLELFTSNLKTSRTLDIDNIHLR